MSKTKIGIIICVVILMGFVGYFAYEYFGSNTSKVDDVINITNNNNKFLKDKKVTFDNKKNIYLIDNQYEVQKKNGYFVMNVNNDSDGLVYCAFVADYESGNFDLDADGVYNTCLKTLDGTIDYGVIHVEKQGSYKQLIFNYVDKTRLISDVVYNFDDKIKFSAMDYLISKDLVVISDISSGKSEELNVFNVCGSINNAATKVLEISLYDGEKNLIFKKPLNFNNNKFCSSFEDISTVPIYFSINYKNS